MGAANTYREIGARAGICVFLADVCKGIAAVMLARWLGASYIIVLFSGFAAVAGHNWPLFLKFHGGRGEATTIGVLSTVLPREMAILLPVAGICLLVTHNVILASALLFIPLPLVCWWLGTPGDLIIYSIALPCMVGLTHFLTTHHLPAKV